MILSSLDINNVRSYESCHIDFDSGTTLLIGDIGCGKSSILMSIEFALFGLGGQNSDALLSKGKESGSVQLTFESGGHTYEIFRALKSARGKIAQDAKSAWISTDGIRDETLGVGEMKQKVIEILGTDEPSGTSAETSIFRYAVYTPQEDMRAVLSNPVKRQETIRRAFKIDGFATARENAKKVVADIKRTMKEYAIRFENMEALKDKLSSYQDKVDGLTGTITLLRTESESASSHVQSCEEAYAKLELEREIKTRLTGEVDVLESKMNDCRQKITTLVAEIDECSANIDALQEKLNSGTIQKPECSMTSLQIDEMIAGLRPKADELIHVSARIEALDSEIKKLQPKNVASIAPLLERLDGINGELATSRSSRDEMMEQSSAVRANISMLEENADGLQTSDSCPLCQQAMSEGYGSEIARTVSDRIVLLQSESDGLTSRIKETDKSIKKMESELVAVQNEIRTAESAKEALDSIAVKLEQIESLKADAELLQNDRARLTELEETRHLVLEYEESTALLTEAKINIEHAKLQAGNASEAVSAERQSLNSLGESLAEKRTEIERFAGLEDNMQSTKADLAWWRGTESKLKADLAASDTNLKNTHDAIQECKKEISDRNTWKDRHATLGRYQEWMDKIFIPSIQIMEEQSLEYIRARFNRLYGDFYSMLLDDATKESNIDADFTPVVSESGHEQSVQNLSGGEKTSIALAYRLTLAKMVREDSGMDSGVLMLDEPTDGFSKSQLEKVRTVLDEAGATQVILVSHDAELESYSDRIYRVSKFGGRSQITS